MKPLELADGFEDDLTRELPSALRTFTDLEPFEPSRNEDQREVTVEVADEDIFEVEQTRKISLSSISPLAIDLGPPPAASPMATEWREDARALLANPRLLMIAGGAALFAWLVAGMIGLMVGLSPPSRAHAAIAAAVRTPRVAQVEGAREAIFAPPPTAPAKAEEALPAPPAPPPRVVVARPAPLRRPAPPRPPAPGLAAPPPPAQSGRGHLGSDRGTTPRR